VTVVFDGVGHSSAFGFKGESGGIRAENGAVAVVVGVRL